MSVNFVRKDSAFEISCDVPKCQESDYYGATDFADGLEQAKAEGWTSVKAGNGFENKCKEHSA